jgi:hypothetical protein
VSVPELREDRMSVEVSCEDLVDPKAATDKSNVESAVVEGRTLELRQGRIDGVQYAWARLSDAHDGDVICFEVSGDSGESWLTCGKRTIVAGGRNYTDARRTSSSSEVCMRAVTQLVGPRYQTASWC